MRELLKLAEIPKSTFYYHLKNMKKEDKYKVEKDEILSIFHENKGRYGYRRITLEMRNRGYIINQRFAISDETIPIFIRAKRNKTKYV